MKPFVRTEGSIALEASLILPLFTVFIIALICMMKISMTDTALQSSVTESVKVMAAHMYPIQLVSDEINTHWKESGIGQNAEEVMDMIRQAKEKAGQINDFIDEYIVFVPETLLPLVEIIRQLQDEAQESGREAVMDFEESLWEPLICQAMTPLVIKYADSSKLDTKSLKVTSVILPDLNNKNDAFLGIEASYTFKLPLPFFHKEIRLVKRAYERVWVGL